MSEINLGQFLKNAFNYSIGKPVNQTPVKTSSESFQQMQSNSMKTLEETMQNMQKNYLQRMDIITTQLQLKQLNNLEKSMMLKDLFDFPRDIKELLESLIKPQMQGAQTKDLNMLLSQQLDMSKLLQMLQENGKQAAEKLAKIISTLNQSGVFKTQELKEMLVLINACIPAADASPQLLMKTLMLMYLPWLPLTDSSKLDINYEDGGKNSSDSENLVTIFIMTKTYGLVRVTLFKEESELNIEVNCSENFPKKEFHEALMAESTGFDLSSSVAFTVRKPSDKDENEEKAASVNFTSSQKVSPHLLIIVHAIIYIVMGFDRRSELNIERSKKLDEY